ncbi:MAG: AmmeMemoRadiSam system protein B [Gammaproteobacteria bacterium]
MTIREPAVAGMFYPAAAEHLRDQVTTFLRSAVSTMNAAPKVLIVPHAGYAYSGPVAAEAFHLLAQSADVITRVALLGPAHRVYLEGMALPSADAFSTPLGTVTIDADAVEAVRNLPGVSISDAAHRNEHSLEVQLPFLQCALDGFTLLPIVVGRCPPEHVGTVIDAVWGGPETLIVVSTDLSHYLGYQDARSVDDATRRRILDKVTNLDGHEACGAHAVNGLMSAEHCRNMSVAAIDLRNSGDTAGMKDRVVGYGAFVMH